MTLKRLCPLLFCLLLATPASAGNVSLNFTNADIVPVLRILAKEAGMNIFIGPEVQGEVTVSLVNKPALGALGLILAMQERDYRYKVLGNTIVVASPEKLDEIPDDLFSR